MRFKPYLRHSAALLTLLGAAQAKALTFDEALKSSTSNSHELKELRLEIQSSRWNEDKALAGYLPRLDLDGQHLFNEAFTELELAFGGSNVTIPAIAPYTSLGLTATINVFNGFRDENQLSAARLQNQAARLRLTRAEERKKTEIRSLFYRALGSQMLLDVAKQNIETLQTHSADVSHRISSGVSTRYDSLRVEVQLEDAKTEKVAAESNIAIARAKLFEAIGQADDGEPLLGKLPDDLDRISFQTITAENIVRADRSALLAERDQLVKVAAASKAHWLPQVSLFGDYEWYNNYNHSITGSDERFKAAYGLGVRVSWNIFDGGASLANQQQASVAIDIAQEKIADFDQNSPLAIEEAKRRFSYDLINYSAKLTSIRKAQEALRLARSGAKAGTRTNTEVLDAAVDLNRAKASAVKSQIDAIEALGQLELAAGHSLR